MAGRRCLLCRPCGIRPRFVALPERQIIAVAGGTTRPVRSRAVRRGPFTQRSPRGVAAAAGSVGEDSDSEDAADPYEIDYDSEYDSDTYDSDQEYAEPDPESAEPAAKKKGRSRKKGGQVMPSAGHAVCSASLHTMYLCPSNVAVKREQDPVDDIDLEAPEADVGEVKARRRYKVQQSGVGAVRALGTRAISLHRAIHIRCGLRTLEDGYSPVS